MPRKARFCALFGPKLGKFVWLHLHGRRDQTKDLQGRLQRSVYRCKTSPPYLHGICQKRTQPVELLGLAKSQQSVKTSFRKVVCELKAAELDFPSSVLKTGLYRQ
jgi:hypothetical protein